MIKAVLTGEAAPADGECIGTATQSDGIVVHTYRRLADALQDEGSR